MPEEVTVPLVVVLGAGASRGAAPTWGNGPQPPLTTELFDESLYGSLLEEYDLAHQAGRFISDQQAENDALSLEHALHALRNSEHEHQRRMAYAVPPYLQHLLHQVSFSNFRKAARYDRLIERLLRLPDVCFITLNYDVMLDRRLAAHHPLDDFDDYISRDKNWSLVKLHGSINWSYDLDADPDPASPRGRLPTGDKNLRCFPPSATLGEIRHGNHDYPALALPEGPEDRVVLPSRHLWWIESKLAHVPNFDLLVIGYSGLDVEVLNLITRSSTQVRLMTVVNQSLEEAEVVFGRFRAAGIEPNWLELAHGDFGDWADAGGLDKLVAQFGGPYPDAR
jgi:hypothetical protein